jgi:hypothetical protein
LVLLLHDLKKKRRILRHYRNWSMSAAALVNAQRAHGTAVQQPLPQSLKDIHRTSITKMGAEDTAAMEHMTPSRPTSAQASEEESGGIPTPQGKATTTQSSEGEQGDTAYQVLAADIRNILLEVARTGCSATLNWTESAKANAKDPGSSTASRRPLLYSPSGGGGGGPARKKQRNGLHHTTHRPGQRRPLSIRTGGATSQSGSEIEDTSQYDSEGTSNSEFSIDRKGPHLFHGITNGVGGKHFQAPPTTHKRPEGPKRAPEKYQSLRQVFHLAIGTVLDHFFEKRGGYKLSPAEKRRNAIVASSQKKDNENYEGTDDGAFSADEIFKQRKQRVLSRLTAPSENPGKAGGSTAGDGPAFTIQRIAEVLASPERYYTQTHKLCNCLEKLLLVTSSIKAFGGTTGGNSSQSRKEAQETAALADERGRLLSEYRQRRLRRSLSLSEDGRSDIKTAPSSPPKAASPVGKTKDVEDSSNGDLDNVYKEDLVEAARASLRSKFDHVGIDAHAAVAGVNRDPRAVESRSMTNSPPPPFNLVGGVPPSLAGHGALLRAHSHDQDHQTNSLAVRKLSPIMFKTTPDGTASHQRASPTPVQPTHQNLQLLQMHHAAALAGVSPFTLMGLTGGTVHAPSAVGSVPLQPGGGMMPHWKEVDVECRSSASSDVDSESDFDDSASDRSDGSDSNEPASNSSAAFTLALNRLQGQQQQQQPSPLPPAQRRVLGSTSSSAFSNNNAGQRPHQLQQPPNDTSPGGAEYQSGDSVDSLRAEDSDSSSEMAD